MGEQMAHVRTSEGYQIFRYEVPVDDRWHEHRLSGAVLHVAARRVDLVEFWALRTDDQFVGTRRFRVFGTGHPLPAGLAYVGTALVGPLVWHLMEQR
jgi:hypothetical protein